MRAGPKWEMAVLTSHEAVPGHHLQIALQYENAAGVPMIRRMADFTAYAEGWGLYAESLGDQLGLYSDAYGKFGQLTYDMWRAVRLVVDTGCTSRDGLVSRLSSISRPTRRKANWISPTRSTATSPGRARPWPTKSDK